MGNVIAENAKHLKRKIDEVGMIKRRKFQKMQQEYHFDEWHISPYELREYAQKVAEYIASRQAETVVDIGCGLGEILRHVGKDRKRIGFDLSQEVITAARTFGEDIEYHVGSFDSVEIPGCVDYLITLGFMHGSREDTWRDCYHKIAEKNDIRHFVVDTLPETENSHYLDFTKILPANYKRIERMGPYLSGRYIEIYEKEG